MCESGQGYESGPPFLTWEMRKDPLQPTAWVLGGACENLWNHATLRGHANVGSIYAPVTGAHPRDSSRRDQQTTPSPTTSFTTLSCLLLPEKPTALVPAPPGTHPLNSPILSPQVLMDWEHGLSFSLLPAQGRAQGKGVASLGMSSEPKGTSHLPLQFPLILQAS